MSGFSSVIAVDIILILYKQNYFYKNIENFNIGKRVIAERAYLLLFHSHSY